MNWVWNLQDYGNYGSRLETRSFWVATGTNYVLSEVGLMFEAYVIMASLLNKLTNGLFSSKSLVADFIQR